MSKTVSVKAHSRKSYTRKHPRTGKLIRVKPSAVDSYTRKPAFRLIRTNDIFSGGASKVSDLFHKAFKEGKLHLSEQKNYYRVSVTKD